MTAREAKIQDMILTYLYNRDHDVIVREIADALDEEFDTVYSLCTDMESRNHLTSRDIAAAHSGPGKLVKITPEGKHFFQHKGYLQLYEKEKELKTREDLIKDLTIKELKGNIFQLKYSWLILIISAVFGFISGNWELILNAFK